MAYIGNHAVVIGGSIAGLTGARVLADHFQQVTVLERDRIDDGPEVHKSTPQGHHVHTLLLGGMRVLSSLYPGFEQKLEGMGAVGGGTQDMVNYHSSGKTYSPSGKVKEPRDFGWTIFTQSRGLLEQCVRQLTLGIPNVRFESEANVRSLLHDNSRVHGVRYEHHGTEAQLEADLVLDTGGRGSHALQWLTELGFQRPPETVLGVDFAYSSTIFRIPGYNGEPEHRLLFYADPPTPHGAILWKIENDLWQVSLGGRFGDYPPTDHDGFLEFTRSLWTPRLYEILKNAERVAEISHHRFPTSVWRHYESLPAWPEHFLFLGDAICSFNPIYGQGMSSAALQVSELQNLLNMRAAESRGLEGLAAEFFPKAAEVIKTPWSLAAGSDLAYPKTKGERPPDFKQSARYFATLNEMTADDFELHRLVTEVFQLICPISALSEEPLRSRVLARMQA